MTKQRDNEHISRWVKCFVVLYLCLMGMAAVHAANYRVYHVEASNSEVLICLSPNAYAYHSHYCRGLKNCKSKVIRTTQHDAQKRGYKACKICY